MFCAAENLDARVKELEKECDELAALANGYHLNLTRYHNRVIELEASIIHHRDAVHRDAHLDWQLWSVIKPEQLTRKP